jgi:D-lactate dehydrogenase (quinone)
LRGIVGQRHVLTGERATVIFASGYRTGSGRVAAVVRPGSLVEQWRSFCASVGADHIVIAQAANTGLTGDSTPRDLWPPGGDHQHLADRRDLPGMRR